MKNNSGRFKIIVLVSIILFFYAMTIFTSTAATREKRPLLQEEVKGVVKDQSGIPIGGVTVQVKGKNRGTITNFNGEYSIVAGAADILVFSYLGFQTKEISVSGQSSIDVILTEGVTALEAVEINAGYYNTTRRESTGNISKVTSEEIELQPVVSPLGALQGRMAGVEIIPRGNQPGMAARIEIRGRNSLREEGNYPLYIIDGVPVFSTPVESNTVLGNPGPGMDPLNTLSLSNIESIEVLKDADATAIYGSRGANGVVLITTKKGKRRKTGFEASMYSGVATVPYRVDLLNTKEYLAIRRSGFENDGEEPTPGSAFDLLSWDQDRYTDWQDFFFGGTSFVNNVNLATSGGNENTSFRLGGSYHTQGTVYTGDFDYRKLGVNLNLNHTSDDKKFRVDLSVNYGADRNELAGNVNIMDPAFYLPPNAPSVFKEDGSLNWEEWNAGDLGNPLAGFFNTSKTQVNNLVSGLGLTYHLIDGLRFKTHLGFTSFDSRELLKKPRRSYNPEDWENISHTSSHLQNAQRTWIAEPQLDYNLKLNKGSLDALVGATFQESLSHNQGFTGEGYVTESLIGNLSAADRIVNAQSYSTRYRYNALFGRVGINWDQSYFLNFTGRRDGSSRFGPGKKWANFWAIGGAWVFSEASFFNKDQAFLSFGKLRGSYGTTGNDQIGDYGYLDAYEATAGSGGLYPTQLSNPNYSWEVNKKLEAALEIGFWDERLQLDISWFRNRSSSQLVGYPLPGTTGFSSVQANLPATVQNTGWEFLLSSDNIASANFSWQTSINMTFPENELVRYPALEESSYANTYREGYPLDISLLYEYQGLDPETGFYKVKDVNEDGRFDYEDRVVIQEWGRAFFGGIQNKIEYKNFSLQFFCQFAKQEGVLSLFDSGSLGNQRQSVAQGLDGNSRFQKISVSAQARHAYSRVLYTTFPVVDASFLRLKNLSLGFNIPSSVMHSLQLDKGKIFLAGQNLYTLTAYEGMDPELPQGGSQFGSLRTLTAGVQFQF